MVPFTAGRSTASLVVVPVNSAGAISVFNSSTGAVTARADIVGYYLGASRLTWGTPTQIDTEPAQFAAVSCTSTTFCMAGDSGGFYFRYDGTSWKRLSEYGFPSSFYETYNITGMTCTSSTFCVSVSTYTSDVSPFQPPPDNGRGGAQS